jgi:hypothetical protein
MVETPTLRDETGALALCAVYTKGKSGANGIRAVSCQANVLQHINICEFGQGSRSQTLLILLSPVVLFILALNGFEPSLSC